MNAPWAAPTDVEEFTAAASWLLARVPVTKQTWELLDERAQRKAFTVAGVARADTIRDVLLALDRAVTNGETLDDFRKRVGQQLVDAWAGSVSNPAWRLETIFRTNAQLAYGAGRHQQMTEPAILKVRPFWQFDAILDNRVTLMCEQADGTILPHDHPWWQANYPPRHFNCRSVVRSIRKSQAERKGITKDPPKEQSQDGFGLTPDAGEWKPVTKKYPPEIRTELEARLKRLNKRPIQRTPKPEKAKAKPKKAPKTKPEHTVEHWEKEFSKYGAAAKSMAWGRAMQERGLDLTTGQAAKLIAKHGLGDDKAFQMIAKAAGADPNVKLRDLSFGGLVDPMAAILGHVDSVASAKGTAKPTSVTPKAKAIAKQASKWFDRMLDKRIDAKVAITWSTSRAKCTPGAIPNAMAGSFSSLVHEWAHAIEMNNGSILKAAKAFLEARTAGEAAKSLRFLTGQNYKLDEIAKPDKFFNPYCGKIYSAGWTELLSMGAEAIAEYPFTLYSMDAEHFWWVLGALGGYA